MEFKKYLDKVTKLNKKTNTMEFEIRKFIK